MEIRVDIPGLEDTKRYLSEIGKQLPFATALALTRTAKEVQREEIAHIRSAFTVRGSWLREGGKFGVGITPASKQDLVAVVESRAPWLEAHEEGATRTPAGSHFAIPQADIRRTKTQVIARSHRPKALKRAFKVGTRKGIPLLLQRIGRGKRSALRVMYQLTGKAEIKPRLQFFETGRAVVDRTWKQIFSEALERAIRTAR
ncbi:MAG: hypothetical protein IH577_04100 [Deltaproteobacteria bacterium]|nr:hypothetical protein [Deltaproteobacteria bacterium]